MGLELPRMNGRKASSQILKMACAAKNGADMTHIVAMTSNLNSEISEELKSIGIKKVYAKPLKYKQIKEIMELYYLAERT